MPKEYGTPGPRAIYPEMCDSRSLARCGIVANALWPRLIAQADDQGRLAGNAVDVLGLCFPKMLDKVTTRAVRAALDELVAAGMIQLYEVDGEPYIQILTWWDWQAGMRRAYPSRHPAPPRWDDAVYGFEEHPATYRAVRGLPARKRAEDDDPEPHENGTVPAPEPHRAGSVRAAQPQRAGTVPAPEPHGAALAGAPPRARVPAQPRPRGAVPDRSPNHAGSLPSSLESDGRPEPTSDDIFGTTTNSSGKNGRASDAYAGAHGMTRLGELLPKAQR